MTLTAVDLFCGAGGTSKGVADSGVKIVGAYDHWDKALETYQFNLPHPTHKHDLSSTQDTVDLLQPLAPNLIVGSPPCQDFSNLNHQQEGARAQLTFIFAKIITTCQPQFLLMENVPPIRNSNTYQLTTRHLQNNGYHLYDEVVDANFCGVPQKRKRLFLFGSLDPTHPTRFEFSLREMLQDARMSVFDAMGEDLAFDYYWRCPLWRNSNGVHSVHNPSLAVTSKFLERDPNYQPHPQDPIHHLEAFDLTLNEIARLQGFPKDWVWPEYHGTNVLMTQIGNAVPPPMAKLMTETILTLQ